MVASIRSWADSLFAAPSGGAVALLWAWAPPIQVFDLAGGTLISDAGFGASARLYLVSAFWLAAQLAPTLASPAPGLGSPDIPYSGFPGQMPWQFSDELHGAVDARWGSFPVMTACGSGAPYGALFSSVGVVAGMPADLADVGE